MKWCAIKLLVFCLISLRLCAQKAINIEGQCVDENGEPLLGVNVTLVDSLTRSKIIRIEITDEKGIFRYEKVQKGVAFRFSIIGYQTIYRNSPCEDTVNWITVLKPMSTILPEVNITSEILNSYGIRDEIFLTKKDREVGANALDAISNLPQFRVNLGDGKLLTQMGVSVLIIINGHRASEQEVMALQADDILKLTFYADPPPRYAHENFAASILEIKTKHKKDRNYFASLDLKNSITTGYGTNLFSFMYTDSLNQLSAAYFIDYRDLNKNSIHSTYQYDNHKNIYSGLPGKYNGQYHIGQLSYQRAIGKSVCFSRLSYRGNPGNEEYTQRFHRYDANKKNGGISHREVESGYHGWDFDLYFTRNINDSCSFIFNVVNTFYTSSSKSHISRMVENDIPMNYSFKNQFNNHSYSIIGEGLYSKNTRKSQWNVGLYFIYKTLDQTYNKQSKSSLNYYKGYLFTDYSGNIKKINYTVGIGMDNSLLVLANGGTHNYWRLRPLFSLNYLPKGDNKTVIRYTFRVGAKIPETGHMTANSIVNIDEHYYYQGNSNLSPSYSYNNMLNFQHMVNGGKFYTSASIFYNYHIKPYVSTLLHLQGDNEILKTYANLRDMKTFGYSISGNWRPLSIITLQPYYQYTYLSCQTPNNNVKQHIHNAGISMQFVMRNVQAAWNGNFPFTTIDGDVQDKHGLNLSASVLWKHKTLSLGAEWIYNPHPSITHGEIDNFHFEEEMVWGNFRSLFNLRCTYYFSAGKQHVHTKRKLNNNDSDSGLIKDNTAK